MPGEAQTYQEVGTMRDGFGRPAQTLVITGVDKGYELTEYSSIFQRVRLVVLG